MLRKTLLGLFFVTTLSAGSFLWGQTSNPAPTYDDNDVPVDLSVGEPKKIKPQAKTTTTTVTTEKTTTSPAPAPVPAPVVAPALAKTTPAASGTVQQPSTTTTTVTTEKTIPPAPAPSTTTSSTSTTTVTPLPIPTPVPAPVPAAPVAALPTPPPLPVPMPTTPPTTTQAPATLSGSTPVAPLPTTPAATTSTTTTTTTSTPPAAMPMPMPTPTPTPSAPNQAGVPTIPAVELVDIPADGGPLKDAGPDLATALPITYAKYDAVLAPQDMIDTYKFYARANEGIGMILTPTYPSTQFAVDLLGEAGELLSQTQATQPGAVLSFQTSPLDKNATIYIQVKDSNLSSASPLTELRPYTLELKPIVVAQPIVPVVAPTTPASSEEPAKPVVKEKTKSSGGNSLMIYTLLGVFVLIALVTALIVLRKMKKSRQTTGE